MNPTYPVRLRDVADSDIPIFFGQQLDAEANHMAAFTSKDPSDRAAFDHHWRRIRADADISPQTILQGEVVVGYVVSFDLFGDLSVGYWLGRAYWGQGLATAALRVFLAQMTERPLYARAASDNLASLRVLQKCGFKVIGADTGFAYGRGAEVEELILRLNG